MNRLAFSRRINSDRLTFYFIFHSKSLSGTLAMSRMIRVIFLDFPSKEGNSRTPRRWCPPGGEPSQRTGRYSRPLSSLSILTSIIFWERSPEWLFIRIWNLAGLPGANSTGVTSTLTPFSRLDFVSKAAASRATPIGAIKAIRINHFDKQTRLNIFISETSSIVSFVEARNQNG